MIAAAVVDFPEPDSPDGHSLTGVNGQVGLSYRGDHTCRRLEGDTEVSDLQGRLGSIQVALLRRRNGDGVLDQ